MDDDDRYYEYLHEEAQDEWFRQQVEDNLGEIFDEHKAWNFRETVASWCAARWPVSEETAYRVGTEARRLLHAGFFGPATISSATCVEVIVRDLALKPVLVGRVLGSDPVEDVLQLLVRAIGRQRAAAVEHVLRDVAGIDVGSLRFAA